MPARYLLDADICVYALSGRYPQLRHRVDRMALGRAATSVVVHGELHFGIAKSSRPDDALQRLNAFTEIVNVLPMPPEAGEHYGDIRAALTARGTPIGANDLWIAAHARAANLIVVTHNTREFSRVEGLMLEDWV